MIMETEVGETKLKRAMSYGMRTSSRSWKRSETNSSLKPQEEMDPFQCALDFWPPEREEIDLGVFFVYLFVFMTWNLWYFVIAAVGNKCIHFDKMENELLWIRLTLRWWVLRNATYRSCPFRNWFTLKSLCGAKKYIEHSLDTY